MIEKPDIKKTDKRDKHLPQNFEQLIEMYDLEKLWPYILQLCESANQLEERSEFSIGRSQPSNNVKLWVKCGHNLLDPYTLVGHNATVAVYAGNDVRITQTEADTSQNSTWKLQKYKNGSYVSQIANFSNQLGIMSSTFYKDDTFDTLYFGVNGSVRDTLVSCDISNLENWNYYTISWNVTNITQGSFAWKNVQIVSGRSNIDFEYYTNRSIRVRNTSGSFYPISLIESGSNENGYWQKYDDGTLRCQGKITVSKNTSYGTIYFPKSFSNKPFIFIQNICYDADVHWSVGVSQGTSWFYAYPRTGVGAIKTDNPSFAFYEAIGRWK